MKTVYSQTHELHFPKGELYGGELVRPFECPERCTFIVEALKQRGFNDFMVPDDLDMTRVRRVHSAPYLEFLEAAWSRWALAGYKGEAIPTVFPARRMQQREPDEIDGKLGFYAMAIETAITAGTWQAACDSAAVAQTAQQLISCKGESAAFALCRPPGHHAGVDLYGGYCFLNNAAIAAQGFLDDGASRVAILDIDFHHGNGTQDIFYNRSDVLFLSLHGEPKDAFPHFLGYADETGSGPGAGFNQNYPMPVGTNYDTWSEALTQSLKRIREYKPDALIISLGVDTFKDDPISFFKLQSDDFLRCGSRIGNANLPTLFVMEGGYAVEEIGTNTANVLQGYLGA